MAAHRRRVGERSAAVCCCCCFVLLFYFLLFFFFIATYNQKKKIASCFYALAAALHELYARLDVKLEEVGESFYQDKMEAIVRELEPLLVRHALIGGLICALPSFLRSTSARSPTAAHLVYPTSHTLHIEGCFSRTHTHVRHPVPNVHHGQHRQLTHDLLGHVISRVGT